MLSKLLAGSPFPGQMSHLASGTLGKRPCCCSKAHDISHLGVVLPRTQAHSHLTYLATSSVSFSCSAVGTLKLTQMLSGAGGTGMLETFILSWQSLSHCELQVEVHRQMACPEKTATLMRQQHKGTPHSKDKTMSLVNPELGLYNIQHEVRV